MTIHTLLAAILLLLALPLAADPHAGHGQTEATDDERRILYWYDPMYPQQHFDEPGRSPFMDMDLVPRYADAGDDGTSLRIDPSLTRNLGMRLTRVETGQLTESVEVSALLGYDQRRLNVLQTRTQVWVDSVAALAPEDVLEAGTVLAELLVPDWVAAQEEYLALRRLGDAELTAAAWQRLRLSGMPEEMMQQLRQSHRVQTHWSLRSPVDGVLLELPLRAGMSLPAGSTLARINGLEQVWLELAVPQSQASMVQPGQAFEFTLPGMHEQSLSAVIERLLPEADSASRVVLARAILDNPEQRLRPGMSGRARLTLERDDEQLLVAADAVIRTGRQDLVMLAEEGGRFRPQQVRVGREGAEQVEILEGLEAGQLVVSGAQFLIDSEASLRGIMARASEPLDQDLHSAEGVVLYRDEDGLMLDHGPFESLGMAGMAMQFALDPELDMSGIEDGDAVRVWVREEPDGLPIVHIEKLEAQP